MRRTVTALTCTLAVALGSAAVAHAGAVNPWNIKDTLNIAHQGGEDEFPSNTLYAFKKAKLAGADMLELDIGVTSDDKVIVMHDTSVDRTTSGTGLISELTLKQIKKLGSMGVNIDTLTDDQTKYLSDWEQGT